MEISNEYLLFENTKLNDYKSRQLKIIAIGGFLFNLLFLINNLVYDDIEVYNDMNDSNFGPFIKTIFITDTIVYLTMWLLSILAYYTFTKKIYILSRNLIFGIYLLNLIYTFVILFIPWVFIIDIFSQISVYRRIIDITFNMVLTFILFIPNLKGASLRQYIYTGKRVYYTIAIVIFIFELLLTLIVFGIGIQAFSFLYLAIENNIPLICFISVSLLFILYNCYIIKYIEINKNFYDYISIILGIAIISIGFYLMIFFDIGFNIINTIFIGNISSLAIFEFIGLLN
jgi:hypothetical protein